MHSATHTFKKQYQLFYYGFFKLQLVVRRQSDICSINIFRNHKSNNGEVFDN